MRNIITGISGKYNLVCFPFNPHNSSLQLIKVLDFSKVQCINFFLMPNSLCVLDKKALPILKLHDYT